MNPETLPVKNIIEAALMAAENPLTINQMLVLFEEENRPEGKLVRDVLSELQTECEGRGIELKEVASGFRYQAKQDYAPWLKKMWEERPPRYSRAFLETLVLIAYRQPVTRAVIEEIRGVAVSSHIIKTLAEREWIKVVGHRDVPGKPALLGTTKKFLDYFNLKSLSELPTLAEIKDLESKGNELEKQLQLEEQEVGQNSEIEIEGSV
jgi:segregation and condensation protein B